MTKQSKIKEAYGEHWETVKDFVDENGWTEKDCDELGFDWLEDIEHHDFEHNNLWRPNSLIGLEENNGWIKIESEADLPKIEGNYWVIDRFLESNPSKEHWEIAPIVSINERWMHRFTHYQPLEKPQLPIY